MKSFRSYLALLEAPLADFDTFGDSDVEGSFRPDDLRAMKSPAWRKKVENVFSKSPYKFNVYTYNGPEGKVPIKPRKPFWDSGMTDDHVVARNLNHLDTWIGVQPLETVERLIGKLPPEAESSISIVLIENEGAQRMPLTPWILVHRCVHAIMDGRSLTDTEIKVTEEVVNATFTSLMDTVVRYLERSPIYRDADKLFAATLIGKMRSAKSKKLNGIGEFMIDTVTQYIVNGKVSFERPMLDDKGLAPEHPMEKAIPKEYQDAAMVARDANDFVKRLGLKLPRMPLDSYTAYDQDGNAVASGDPDPQRLQKLKDRGLTVKVKRVSPRVQTAYTAKMEQIDSLKNLWRQWDVDGIIDYNASKHATMSSDLHYHLARAEKALDEKINAMLAACVGKALVL